MTSADNIKLLIKCTASGRVQHRPNVSYPLRLFLIIHLSVRFANLLPYNPLETRSGRTGPPLDLRTSVAVRIVIRSLGVRAVSIFTLFRCFSLPESCAIVIMLQTCIWNARGAVNR